MAAQSEPPFRSACGSFWLASRSRPPLPLALAQGASGDIEAEATLPNPDRWDHRAMGHIRDNAQRLGVNAIRTAHNPPAPE
jgi:hypothetical protein